MKLVHTYEKGEPRPINRGTLTDQQINSIHQIDTTTYKILTSNSDRDWYTVKMRPDNPEWAYTCNCPAFVNYGHITDCKHMRAIEQHKA